MVNASFDIVLAVLIICLTTCTVHRDYLDHQREMYEYKQTQTAEQGIEGNTQ